MRFIYQQFSGDEFPTQEHLAQFAGFLDYVMEYGGDALEALRRASDDPEHRKLIEQWIKDGLLEKVGVRFRLTPRAVQSLQKRALMEVFRDLKPGSTDGHETTLPGASGERCEGTRPYRFGDAVSDIDLASTLRNSLHRHAAATIRLNPPLPRGAERDQGGSGPFPRKGRLSFDTNRQSAPVPKTPQTAILPFHLDERDFELHQTESKATCSTVILLDMSGSMSRWDRFPQAKKCAMAVHALIRQRFPLDSVDVVGFASGAEVIPEHRLPLVTPKPISSHEPSINLRVPLNELDSAPQHFTNLQMGLLTARQLLARRGGMNKQVFIITDGQPTAHLEGGFVRLIYPPVEKTTMTTLAEALTLAKSGVRFATFALIEDYFYMDWVNFVENLTKLTKGVAFYCTSGDLSQCVMESYLSGRKKKAYLS